MNWYKFWVREDGKNYDDAKRRAAGQRGIIYYLVALYIGYMGFSIIKNRLAGDDTMSYPLAVILTALLVLGAIFVAWYATKRMKREFEQSEIRINDKNEQNIKQ